MGDVRWYTTLALWKSIVFMEGNYKRALAGTTDDPYLKHVRRRGPRARPPGAGGGTWNSRSLKTDRRRTGRPPRAARSGNGQDGAFSGLLIDWGGVLTTNLFVSFHAYCVRAGIDPAKLVGRFKSDPEARELLIELETGKLAEDDFERRFAALLDVAPEGLIDGLFSGVHPDELMVDAVRRAHRAGVRTALVSNSWGVHRYPRSMFSELFDGVVISAEEGIRKPSKRMYELGYRARGSAPGGVRLRGRPALQPDPRPRARDGGHPPHRLRADGRAARAPAGDPAAGGRARLGAPRALTGAAAAGQSRLPRPYISLNMRPSMREVRAL